MTGPNTVQVLDPTVESVSVEAVVASRPITLDHKVLGLLANGKSNSVELLEMVHEIIADRFEFREVISLNKGNASRPCPDNLIEELVQKSDLVITASGD